MGPRDGDLPTAPPAAPRSDAGEQGNATGSVQAPGGGRAVIRLLRQGRACCRDRLRPCDGQETSLDSGGGDSGNSSPQRRGPAAEPSSNQTRGWQPAECCGAPLQRMARSSCCRGDRLPPGAGSMGQGESVEGVEGVGGGWP